MRRYYILLLLLSLLQGGQCVPNHLEESASPYLRQHLCNPVEWYPWGKEAFEKARETHKPIFLSIGYSTCHWCHVMARESFENPNIAELINRWFVAIKVDREELPHIDRRFQRIYRAVRKRSGGWPLTVFLTEEGLPFFIATYLPPEEGYGEKGLRDLVPYYGRLYAEHPEKARKRARAIMRLAKRKPPVTKSAGKAMAQRVVARLWERFDRRYGGWGRRPKFPQSATLRLLADIARATGDERAKRMYRQTLKAMADGGLYDQIDGGFFRYCADRAWQMPHFEKMLYTNAELLALYAQAFRRDGIGRYKAVVNETVQAVNRLLGTPEGLWRGASDAESGGREGGYYLMRRRACEKALERAGFAPKEAGAVLDFLDIKAEGNFDSEYAQPRRTGRRPPPRFEAAKAVLRRLRAGRPKPFVDGKILTSWNGMWIASLFNSADLNATFSGTAERGYRALVRRVSDGKGGLRHQWMPGEGAMGEGLLEDYAYLIDAALSGYARTFQASYLAEADRWAKRALALFYEGDGKWRMAADTPDLADADDRYYTSALSTMIGGLKRLALLRDNLRYARVATESLRALEPLLRAEPERYPEAIRVRLYGPARVVKAPADKLRRAREALARRHPFWVQKAHEGEGWTLCGAGRCFAHAQTLEVLERRVSGAKPSF
ncbi:MAG: thioredoxin domain-containing protein [Epsilonproteobacteria bacterium]|nr:thioredoxin domain-containing protein [Campylobacterota bacterium]